MQMISSGCVWSVHLTCTVLVFISPVLLAPMSDQYSRGVDWLSRYGYLPPPDPRTGQLQTKEGIEKAIKEMQRFAGLKDTGRLDSATLKLMSTPRCSLPDIIGFGDLLKKRRRKRRYATVGLRWKKSDLTWSIQNYPSLHPSLDPNHVQYIMTYAFKAWSDVTNLKFQAASSSEQNTSDIKISFTRSLHDDGYPFDGKGGTLAHAFFPGEYDLAGDTHFDDEESWTYADNRGTDLFSVAVHEFGHALGLSHSSSSPSIMRPYYQGAVGDDIPSYTLPDDDRYAIQSIYGMKTGSPTPSPNKPTPPLPKPPTPPRPKVPSQPDPTAQNRCEGGFDAVANIRGDVFFFKGPYFWRIQRSGSLMSFQPALIKNFWIGLPPGTDKIDAVYERKPDSTIVFFIGSQYLVFKDTMAMSGYPRPLSDWGLISHNGKDVKRVEAAFTWAHNGKTYIFSGGEFWRFNEGSGTENRHQDADYPRDSSLWKGVPINPDDIITWGEGDTYFFKNNSYWVLKSGELDQESVSLGSTAVDWMKCPEPTPTKPPDNPRQKGDCYCGINGALQMSVSSWILSAVVLLYPAVFI
ncbi:matrix metalloproteinase-25 isoform X1 [Pimephales promelas]|uniref:matrix metalloproteinase-25 isoform X1 n=3 Tax=Pimephales promelas TaxID=90988 RepID=UPI00195555DB|nr:matrix metalloproteinase-25 isoform X1 [Pimephales promelas]KAG1933418.1 matrix metalloproteinase-25 [Pimephales promelas]